MASYYDFNKDPLGGARPPRQMWQSKPYKPYRRFGLAAPPSGYGELESVNRPYISPSEIADTLGERFRQQPMQYSPMSGGRTLATRSFDPGAMPDEMRGSRFEHLYGGMTSRFILPEQTGPEFFQRQAPATDYQRQLGFSSGIPAGNVAAATVNPSRFWPESAFKPPTYTNQWGEEVPIYGATIDYTTGEYHLPTDRYFPRYFGKFKGRDTRTGFKPSDWPRRR